VKYFIPLCIVMLLLLSAPVSAQDNSMAVSIKGGFNLANLEFENLETGSGSEGLDSDTENLLRLAGGISFGKATAPGIGFDLDLLYVQCGAKQTFEGVEVKTGSTVEIETKLDYLEIAPMLHYTFSENASGPYLLGGGFIGYLIDAKLSYIVNGNETSSDDAKEMLKDINYGVTAGLGFKTAGEGGRGFIVEARYVLGLADIYDSESEAAQMNGKQEVKTRGIYAFAGYRF
jgi:Outer membrane protein beta-barrel domain